MLYVLYAVCVAVFLVFVGHTEFVWRDEVEGRVEVSHSHQKRVYRASVFEVANHVDVKVVESLLRVVNSVEVEHGL